MSKEIPVKFIQEKIQELQTAILFPETSSLVKIPNYVIAAVQADEEGQVWFSIRRPALYMDQDEWQFPCRMDFFKKGLGFHMKVYGKASIISDFNEVASPVIPAGLQQRMEDNLEVMIKLEIQYADYFEIQAEKADSAVADQTTPFVDRLYKLFHIQPDYRIIKENIRLELFA